MILMTTMEAMTMMTTIMTTTRGNRHRIIITNATMIGRRQSNVPWPNLKDCGRRPRLLNGITIKQQLLLPRQPESLTETPVQGEIST
jgi:hypothetical protein